MVKCMRRPFILFFLVLFGGAIGARCWCWCCASEKFWQCLSLSQLGLLGERNGWSGLVLGPIGIIFIVRMWNESTFWKVHWGLETVDLRGADYELRVCGVVGEYMGETTCFLYFLASGERHDRKRRWGGSKGKSQCGIGPGRPGGSVWICFRAGLPYLLNCIATFPISLTRFIPIWYTIPIFLLFSSLVAYSDDVAVFGLWLRVFWSLWSVKRHPDKI